MKYEIVPLKGLDGILFGMDARRVRALMGTGFKSFKRTPEAAFPCDYFADAGVFANYDGTGHLEAIELASPATPRLYGINLLGMGFDAAVKFLMAKDPELDQEADGAISLAMGISLYAPHAAKDPKAAAESVLLFAAGYYD
ncbi:hypothetical protein ACFPPA_07625 [Rhodanobacter ginsengisoli]|uniref:Uncharacterized protein n=1 Tax=Rhodanobacter ginsengisoli TaxID=418646 RepID=A0ABW0QLZ0_9GAMM